MTSLHFTLPNTFDASEHFFQIIQLHRRVYDQLSKHRIVLILLFL